MKNNTLMVAIASALIGAGTVACIQSVAQHDMQKMGSKSMGNTPSKQMHKIMGAPMPHKMTGDTDRDFAAMMAAHHMSAIKASQIEVKHGKVADLRKMAQNMIVAQTKERQMLLKHANMKH